MKTPPPSSLRLKHLAITGQSVHRLVLKHGVHKIARVSKAGRRRARNFAAVWARTGHEFRGAAGPAHQLGHWGVHWSSEIGKQGAEVEERAGTGPGPEPGSEIEGQPAAFVADVGDFERGQRREGEDGVVTGARELKARAAAGY
ncbi:uncharacterized protein A4U43_C01F28770 [Asparagus officinalis]|uniref:Uncharacterized protein n=1 Tax=Asparagus officinalis TaxID=4686 RepID=A0A5P1FT58_ASPOF|nr:uncharacterized protein A4U43_C01F28770 [Asparagus officinalis]